jgi:phosphatidyl-myo-inositol dimannoside synthase
VKVIARVAHSLGETDGRSVLGPGVTVHPVLDSRGAKAFAANFWAMHTQVREGLASEAAIIFRVPSVLALGHARRLVAAGRPYAIETCGDPDEVFRRGVANLPALPILRKLFVRQLRYQCRHATAAAYVTQSALQRKYPCGAQIASLSDVALDTPSTLISAHYGSVDLGKSVIVPPRRFDRPPDAPRLAFVGSLSQPYKGLQLLLHAVAVLSATHRGITLKIVGDGALRPRYQALAHSLGIAARCEFLGALPAGGPVFEALDSADLFVLPSLTEGLPRALLEAMARGLPCVASAVGGIPEILPPEALFPRGDQDALASTVAQLLASGDRLTSLAERNNDVVKNFTDEVLGPRRREFYAAIKNRTHAYYSRH